MRKYTNLYQYYILASSFFLTIAWFIGIVISNQSPLLYEEAFAQEDGPIENLTNIFLIGSLVLISIKIFRANIKWLYIVGFFAVFFVLGEEVSWGQRLFNIQVSDSFQQFNSQKEFNLHNLKPAGISINKWIFGKLLTAVIFTYLLGSQWASKSNTALGRFLRFHEVPVAKGHHALILLALISGLLFIPSGEKWELYELTCVVSLCSILLNDLVFSHQVLINRPALKRTTATYQEVRVAS